LMKPRILKKKIRLIKDEMEKLGIDLWLTFTSESGIAGDPLCEDLIGQDVVGEAAILIFADWDDVAIMADFDSGGAEGAEYYDVRPYGEGIVEPLREVITERKPKVIALNNSFRFPVAAGLRASELKRLEDILPEYKNKFVSSDELIITFRAVLIEEEIQGLKRAARITNYVYSEIPAFLRPGVTEREARDYIHDVAHDSGGSLAWPENWCPLVFFGERTGGPLHSPPTERVLQEGELIITDMGINYEGYCTDVMRTFYLPKPGETIAPKIYTDAFTTALECVDMAAQLLRPGVIGNEIDVRIKDYTKVKGYDPVYFCTGHPIGRTSHEVGPLLGPDTLRYRGASKLEVKANMAYAIEPIIRTRGKFGVGIEENVLVTEKGVEFLTEREMTLILVGKDQ